MPERKYALLFYEKSAEIWLAATLGTLISKLLDILCSRYEYLPVMPEVLRLGLIGAVWLLVSLLTVVFVMMFMPLLVKTIRALWEM